MAANFTFAIITEDSDESSDMETGFTAVEGKNKKVSVIGTPVKREKRKEQESSPGNSLIENPEKQIRITEEEQYVVYIKGRDSNLTMLRPDLIT